MSFKIIDRQKAMPVFEKLGNKALTLHIRSDKIDLINVII
jgi:hypothetical protein